MAKTLDDLKTNITNEIKNIKSEVLNDTFDNMKKRLELVIEANGGHIENEL